MRIASALSVAFAFVVVAACHKTPEEASSADAGAAVAASAVPSAPTGAPAVDASAPDGGQSETRLFCDDVYAADAVRMSKKCAPKDQGIQRGLARAASTLCNDDFNAAVGHGRVSFDKDAARHCVEMLQTQDLARLSDTDTLFLHFPCDRVLLGLQSEGQACRWSVECKDGLACVGYAIGVDGVCKKPPKVGEACTSQRFGSIINDAAASLHHLACAAGGWCDGKQCQAVIAPAKPCTAADSCAGGNACILGKCGKPSDVGAPCTHTPDCKYGLWCNKPASGMGVCEKKRPEGAECPLPDACMGRCPPARSEDGGPPPVPRCEAVCGSG